MAKTASPKSKGKGTKGGMRGKNIAGQLKAIFADHPGWGSGSIAGRRAAQLKKRG